MIRLNNDWKFIYNWTDDFPNDISSGANVRIPHNVCDGAYLPLHYADPSYYSTICGYGRELHITEEMEGKRLFLQFDGAAHIAEVFVNGSSAGVHYGGYTAFRFEITDLVHMGRNLIAVKLDCTENPAIPPFGFVIDYLTYGGLYRDVWLDVRVENHIEDLFVYSVNNDTAHVEITCRKIPDFLEVKITSPDGREAGILRALANDISLKDKTITLDIPVSDPLLWTMDDPNLYKCSATISSKGDTDSHETTFGIRDAVFKADGFYLNGVKTFIRGLNRHQSFPYIGYAATESLQREDARILKEELGCNAVRTSHYPQSRYFLDECDRLGLLVFTELPGWQHIGDAAWKDHALDMLREMIIQCRNHPSVILWGVRINESVDDDEFYERTNALARSLDPSRATSGVRYLEKSHLLEDVYAFNDFTHDGKTPGCRKKADITPDVNKGYLISECNGHMFPTKPFDSMADRQEQALRHARVINAAMAEGDIAGMFGWCMFDYATHKDFGSGDRICYHGVLDSFRNPKLSAYTYSSQSDSSPILEISSSFDIGEYPGGSKGDIYAFTNADEVRLYKNDRFVKTFAGSAFPKMPHGPILIDDIIGDLILDEDGFDEKEARLVRSLLLSAEAHSFPGMPLKDKLRLLYAHFRYKLSFEQGYALYGKYFGNWGNESVRWRFDAAKDGKVVKSVTKTPGRELHIEANASSCHLKEGDCYDMALIRICIKDENGNIASYAQLPLKLEITGSLEIMGPDMVTAEGGMCGTILRTTGQPGEGSLTVSSENAKTARIDLTISAS